MWVSKTTSRSGLLCPTTVHPSCLNVSSGSRGSGSSPWTRLRCGSMSRPDSSTSSAVRSGECQFKGVTGLA